MEIYVHINNDTFIHIYMRIITYENVMAKWKFAGKVSCPAISPGPLTGVDLLSVVYRRLPIREQSVQQRHGQRSCRLPLVLYTVS